MDQSSQLPPDPYPQEWSLDTFPEPNPFFPEPRTGVLEFFRIALPCGSLALVLAVLAMSVNIGTWVADNARTAVTLMAAILGGVFSLCALLAAGEGIVRTRRWRRCRILPAFVHTGARKGPVSLWVRTLVVFGTLPLGPLGLLVARFVFPALGKPNVGKVVVPVGDELWWIDTAMGHQWRQFQPGTVIWLCIRNNRAWMMRDVAPRNWRKSAPPPQAIEWCKARMRAEGLDV